MKQMLKGPALAATLICINCLPVAASQTIDAPIKRVTVYTDQALIARTAHLQLDTGDQVLSIEKLPGQAVEASFRVSASGVAGITVMGISHKRMENSEVPFDRVATLQKQIKEIERSQKQVLADRLAAFSQQRDLMSALISKAGEKLAGDVGKESLSITKWDEAYRYVGEKLREIDDSVRTIKYQAEDVDNQLRMLQNQLTAIQGPQNTSSRSVEIDLRLEKAGEVDVTLEYLVPGASWKPMYDARLLDDSGRVELTYLAEVTQHTGEDWKEVDLTLSTATPSRGTGPGEFMPRYLSEYRPSPPTYANDATISVSAEREVIDKFQTANQSTIESSALKSRPVQTVDNLLRAVAGVPPNSIGQVYFRAGRAGEVSYIVDGVPVGSPLGGPGGAGAELELVPGSVQSGNRPAMASVSNALIGGATSTTTFTTHRKETVPSGGAAIRTTVANWTLNGKLELLSRPRDVAGAYRIVTIKNQGEAPLMPGRVAVFVKSDFLGNAQLNQTIAPNESFDLPFGMEERLTVTRQLWKFTESHSGNKTRLDYSVRVVLANHALTPRQVNLEEPLPVSRDNRVRITVGDIVPKLAQRDISGKGVWSLSINPEDSTIVTIPLKWEYPTGMQIVEK